MKCLEYEIRVRTLGSGLFNAVPAVTTRGPKGTTLTEVLIECCSGPSTSRHLAIRLAEERTQAYLANQYASTSTLPLPALRWNREKASFGPMLGNLPIGVPSSLSHRSSWQARLQPNLEN